MDTVSQILAGLISVAIVLMIAPRVFALNHGKILQNIAIWLGIFLILAFAYRTIGPGKSTVQTAESTSSIQSTPGDTKEDLPEPELPQINEDQGFMPPREE